MPATALVLNTTLVRGWLSGFCLAMTGWETDEDKQLHDRYLDSLGANEPLPLMDVLWQVLPDELLIRIDTSAPVAYLAGILALLMEDTNVAESFVYDRNAAKWMCVCRGEAPRYLSPTDVNNELLPWLTSFGLTEGNLTCPA